jgi:hypothetical protein
MKAPVNAKTVPSSCLEIIFITITLLGFAGKGRFVAQLRKEWIRRNAAARGH